MPRNVQSSLPPLPGPGYRTSEKETEVRGSSLPKPHGPKKDRAWLLPLLGLNPSANLPLQPHFRLLPQSVTPVSIPVFFQLYWAAKVTPGRCGPTVWSQSSPSSYAGSVTRGSCLPVTSWVEVTPIPLAQSMATAI